MPVFFIDKGLYYIYNTVRKCIIQVRQLKGGEQIDIF